MHPVRRTHRPIVAFLFRVALVYFLLLGLLADFFHRFLDNPYSSYYPFVSRYVMPLFQALEGTARLVRTVFHSAIVAADYKFTRWRVGEERWNADQDLRDMVHLRSAQRFLELFKTNGCVYVKVGQYMASMKHLLPDPYLDTMKELQDRAPFVPLEDVRRVVYQDFGMPPEQLFEEFDTQPIAAASLAQVHRARERNTGREVAVKVQYRKVRYFFEGDMLTHRVICWGLDTFFPGFQFDFLQEEMAKYLRTELDFRQEADNGRRATHNFRHRSDVHIPEIIERLSSERVLTTEFIHGVKVNDKHALDQLGLSVSDVAHLLFEAFAEQIYLHGFIHTDPHPGNVFIRRMPDGSNHPQLVILDHGLYLQLPNDFRRNYCQLYKALVLRDESDVKKYCHAMGIEDWQLFSTLILMRSYDGAVVGMGNSVKQSEKDKFILRMQSHMDEMLDVLKKLPREMLMILRNNNLLRAINHDLGVPANRFTVFARMAARGIHLLESTDPYSARDHQSFEEQIIEKDAQRQHRRSLFSKHFAPLQTLMMLKEACMFELRLQLFALVYFMVDKWNRFQITMGWAEELKEEEIMSG